MTDNSTVIWGPDPTDPLMEALREYLRRRFADDAMSPEFLLDQFPARRDEVTEQLRAIELLVNTRKQAILDSRNQREFTGSAEDEAFLNSAKEEVFLDTVHDWALDDDTPNHFGRYQVIEKLAAGGQASLYRCYDPQIGRDVAVKWYRRELGSGEQGPIPDAATLAAVNVRGLIQVHDVGIHENRIFVVLEYVAGRTLDEVTRQSRSSPRQVASYVATAAGIIHELHLQHAIHRDLKPQNILLDESGRIRVIDMGLALLGSKFAWLAGNDAATVGISGTASYMAPEQARGETSKIEAHTDVFGLGAVLYDLTVGHPPYVGSENEDVLSQARRGVVRPPRSVSPKVPWALDRICRRALAPDPHARFRSAKRMQFWLSLYANWRRVIAIAGLLLFAVVLTLRDKDGRIEDKWVLTPGSAVQISVEPGPDDTGAGEAGRAAAARADSNEREVALWVLEKGGRVTIRGREKQVTTAAELPPEPFQVHVVDVPDTPSITDRDLTRFCGLACLQGLNVAGSNLSNDGLATVGKITTLSYLYVGGRRVTDDGLRHLTNLRRLEILFLGRTSITGEGLRSIAHLPLVSWLGLAETQLTDSALRVLPQFRSLQAVDLAQTKVTDVGLQHLVEVPRLWHLDLNATDVTDQGIVHLKAMSALGELKISGTKISPREAETLRAALPNCKVEY